MNPNFLNEMDSIQKLKDYIWDISLFVRITTQTISVGPLSFDHQTSIWKKILVTKKLYVRMQIWLWKYNVLSVI